MIVAETGSLAAAEALGSKICGRFGKETYDYTPSKTVSVGVTVSAEIDNEETIVKRVDNALYMAKAQGKNRVVTLLW